jgi:hypothetical protein
VRTRFAGILLAGVATAAAIGGVMAPGRSFGQSHSGPQVTAKPRHASASHGANVGPGLRASETVGASDPAPKKKPASKTSQAGPPAPSKQPQLTRPDFTAADEAVAQIPGLSDVRFWGDSTADFERALPKQEGPWLILSTGGEEGAYGAGFLNGWSATGSRPEFAVVTGVSTGALMATYVFAGQKFDEELHQVYTTISSSDVFEVATTPESLVDTWPLADMIKKRVTPEMLAAIAAEHEKGRRLFVITTNLDAGRTTVWNMGAIAAHGGEDGLKLFRQVLLAAASIEGMFPPVYITVEANGRQFQEMHGDGGVKGPLFFGPEAYLVPGSPQRLPATSLYVIFNGKLSTEFYLPSRNTAAILGRSIGLALKAGGRLQLALASLAAQRTGIGLSVTSVDDGFDQVGRGIFDPKYMNALYDYGFAKGRGDNRFQNGPPAPSPRSPTASGGASGDTVPK